MNPNDVDVQESFILNPAQASGRESAWLEMMTRDQPPDVKALFERLVKYLNGEHALEKISIREGISRKDVRRVLTALERFVVYVRYLSTFFIPPSTRTLLTQEGSTLVKDLYGCVDGICE